jgi:hypothetical protein
MVGARFAEFRYANIQQCAYAEVRNFAQSLLVSILRLVESAVASVELSASLPAVPEQGR